MDRDNLDKSSVGSTGGKFNQRDVFRKISKLIASRKGPRSLKIAMQIIIFLILASIGVAILAGLLKIKAIEDMKVSLFNSNQVNRVNIQANKIMTILDL